MSRVKCPACGGKTDDGAFCEKCGALLGEGGGGVSAPAPVEHTLDTAPTSVSAVRGASDVRERELRVIVLNDEQETDRTPQATPDRCPAASEPDSSFDECPWLCVERDTVAFCVAESPGLLRLRLTSLASGLQNVQAGVSLFGVVGAGIQPVRWFKPQPGKSGEFSLTVPSLAQGAYGAELSVQFTRENRLFKYSASLELYVYPSASSAKQIAESIVININNDIKMGHAVDFHQSLDAANALERIAGNGQQHTLTELLNLTRAEIRSYRRLNLFESDVSVGCELPPPPTGARLDRLTLAVNDQLLHLVAGGRVTLGRNRGNRIVTRRFGGSDEETARLNGRISKFHCTLEFDGEAFSVSDGGLDESGQMRRSSWGVFWQGRAVKGDVRFPVERFPASAGLGLAGTAEAPDFGLTAHGCYFNASRCAECAPQRQHACRKGKVPAVLLKRADAVPESYALLWSCLDLGRVFPSCAGLIVCHEQGAFSWRSETGSGWLTPGMRLAGNVDVRPFAQVGL